ncbi:MAG TPA: PQQ-binding-like beta-propeller repeat protein, partial [Vicinamibacterales bacterium]|nr:PQQ-binding-like beta-propeller repeat protein [Vicinamibacterales bacterium]
MTSEAIVRKPLRLWPGVAAAAVLLTAGYLLPAVFPSLAVMGLLAAVGGALLILVWWLAFSRARWYERVGAVVLIVAAAMAQRYVVHPSIAGGAMGNLSYMLVLPTLCVALVAWAAASRRLSGGMRAAAAVVAVVLGCLPWMLVRTGGIMGSGKSDLHWRWSPTPEERLLAQAQDEPATPPPLSPTPPTESAPAAAAPAAPAAAPVAPPPIVPTRPAEWPGFRGPDRDGVVRGTAIATDWTAAPPVQVWRRAVGPAWSSFAVRGDRIYTQEQRGGDEVVSAYRLSTGAAIWRHRDHVRFWESNGGAGPRATPTLRDGRVYSFGATGILNSLDEATGAVIWSRNVATDAHVNVPMWGFASSPLVVGDAVIVAASGKLAAYDVTTGNSKWFATSVGGSYSSPQLATIDGVAQVVLMGASGAAGVAPDTGRRLWESPWGGSVTIVQPAVVGDRGIVVTTAAATGGEGIRRLEIARASGKWAAKELWTSNGLKPYFNDYVVHKGYAYGFDGSILSCVDLADGTRKWKGGRYGNGQLVLLPDQDLLLVTSEDGYLALVKAAP